jgi:branched-chain amino acid transport system substrate-binding protein
MDSATTSWLRLVTYSNTGNCHGEAPMNRTIRVLGACAALCAGNMLGLQPSNKSARTQLAKTLNIDHKNTINFGQSTNKRAGSRKYATIIRHAIEARFERANASKKLGDKTLRLLPAIDDQGKPALTRRNIKMLQKEFNIDLFFGNIGTPSALALKPQLEEQQIALLFPWAGSDKLRKPEIIGLVNGTGLITPQIERLVKHVAKNKLCRIALVHPNGKFGKENARVAKKSLRNYDLEPVATISYDSETLMLREASAQLAKASPDAVIFLATSTPAANLIKLILERGLFSAKLLGIDSTFLVPYRLASKKIDFSYTSTVPAPDSNYKIVKQYRRDMDAHFAKLKMNPAQRLMRHEPYNILALSYYIHASIVVKAIKRLIKAESKINARTLVAQIESMRGVDIGDFTVDFDLQTRQAYPVRVNIIGSKKA